MAQLIASQYTRCLATVSESLCQVIAAYGLKLNSRAGTEGSTVSSLFKYWVQRRSVLVATWTTENRWPAVCAGRSSMALFTRTTKLDPGAHGARCARAMAVHHAVGISCQRNSGCAYRPSRVNIMAQGLSTPYPSLSPTHLSIRRGRSRNNYTLHTPSG